MFISVELALCGAERVQRGHSVWSDRAQVDTLVTLHSPLPSNLELEIHKCSLAVAGIYLGV